MGAADVELGRAGPGGGRSGRAEWAGAGANGGAGRRCVRVNIDGAFMCSDLCRQRLEAPTPVDWCHGRSAQRVQREAGGAETTQGFSPSPRFCAGHAVPSALTLPALPCPALPCPALPCPALPSPSLPCPALPSPALPCPPLPCPPLPSPALGTGPGRPFARPRGAHPPSLPRDGWMEQRPPAALRSAVVRQQFLETCTHGPSPSASALLHHLQHSRARFTIPCT